MRKSALEAIKRRVARITPGEWKSRPVAHGYRMIHRDIEIREGITLATVYGPSIDNAIFIVNAPADVRALIVEVERLQFELESLKERL